MHAVLSVQCRPRSALLAQCCALGVTQARVQPSFAGVHAQEPPLSFFLFPVLSAYHAQFHLCDTSVWVSWTLFAQVHGLEDPAGTNQTAYAMASASLGVKGVASESRHGQLIDALHSCTK